MKANIFGGNRHVNCPEMSHSIFAKQHLQAEMNMKLPILTHCFAKISVFHRDKIRLFLILAVMVMKSELRWQCPQTFLCVMLFLSNNNTASSMYLLILLNKFMDNAHSIADNHNVSQP